MVLQCSTTRTRGYPLCAACMACQKTKPPDMDGFVETEQFYDNQISAPIATAVSDMRFEKPHSLSYHVRIRHMVPSITLVWSM